jgi:hypothetical protein
MSKRLAELKSQNSAITAENNALKKKIILLRNDINYIEMIARNELGMVKKGDIVYRCGQSKDDFPDNQFRCFDGGFERNYFRKKESRRFGYMFKAP